MIRKKPRVVCNTIDPQSLVAPATPPGYRTVPHWWVTEELNAFELFEGDPLETLKEEEERLRQRCERQGTAPLWVQPSPLYKIVLGREGEMAFPEVELARFYPESP